VLAASAISGCSSGGSGDGGSPNPSSAVSVSVSPSNQEQSVQIPQQSGPITGTILLPPITVSGTPSGTLTLAVLSGTNVAFEQTAPQRPSSALTLAHGSDAALPGGPYLFEMTLTAPFAFTLTAFPGFNLNLGSLGEAAPNGNYVIVAVLPSGAVSYFPVTAYMDTLSYTGEAQTIAVGANQTLTVGIALASSVTIPPVDAGTGPSLNADAGPAAVFVVDSTATLYVFDAEGNLRQSTKLSGTVGDLNGGQVALANGNVYVTLGTPTNAVVAFGQDDLAPVTLPTLAFHGLSVPRGIVFDSNNSQFYIANGATTVTAYDMYGGALSSPPSFNAYGPSGIAYDSGDHTLWVANYGPSPYGTDEYNENGANTVSIDIATQFVSPHTHTTSYSIGYCPGACALGNIYVGFIDDGSNLGTPVIGSYALDGGYVSSITTITKPYQLTFDSQTYLWVADKSGLHKFSLGETALPPGFAAALTPPIYGVGAL
jgi:hypothetical protein